MNCELIAIIILVLLVITIIIINMVGKKDKHESYQTFNQCGCVRDNPAPPLSPFITYKKYACPYNPQYILQQSIE